MTAYSSRQYSRVQLRRRRPDYCSRGAEGEAVGLDDELDQKLSDFDDSLHAYLRESLNNGQAMGLLRDTDTEITATCVLGSVRQVLYRELVRHDGKSFDVDRVARQILEYNCVGLMRTRVLA